jgi:hypothetical protein
VCRVYRELAALLGHKGCRAMLATLAQPALRERRLRSLGLQVLLARKVLRVRVLPVRLAQPARKDRRVHL